MYNIRHYIEDLYVTLMNAMDEGQQAFVLAICAIVLMSSVMALLLWMGA